MLWTPRSFREAKTRMRLAQQERDAGEKKKTEMRELARANELYNEKIAEEKRAKRAREKEECDQRHAQERAEIDARKAQRQTDKEARDAQRAVQSSRRGKRKALQSAAPRKEQNRGGAAARSRRIARQSSPSPPATYNSRGRKIAPRKRSQLPRAAFPTPSVPGTYTHRGSATALTCIFVCEAQRRHRRPFGCLSTVRKTTAKTADEKRIADVARLCSP
ncbi:hypothetical protein AA0121_g13338 [Alternaria tenuissima]|nr:hypothetical protein AA0121_g13338 [Alternaria tenuissima]